MIERKPIVVNYRPSHLYWLLALIAAFVLAILFLGKLWGTMVSDWELAEKALLAAGRDDRRTASCNQRQRTGAFERRLRL